MIYVWIRTLNRARLIVMPYLYGFIYDSDTVLKRHITGLPKSLAQWQSSPELLDLIHNNFSHTPVLNTVMLTVLPQDLMQ